MDADTTLEQLLARTRAALDTLATAAGLEPAGFRTKADVAAAILEANGQTRLPRFTVRLAGHDLDGEPVLSFQVHVDGQEIELDTDQPEFSTVDRSLFQDLVSLPFLEAVEA